MLAAPVLADINQKASISGENGVVVTVNQEAWNYGSGDINQDVGVHVTGNTQIMDQDNVLVLSSDGDVNSTITGLNLITVDLNQYGNNIGSGDISQGIEILVYNNVQIIDQDVVILEQLGQDLLDVDGGFPIPEVLVDDLNIN